MCTLLDDLHSVLADASATMADSSSCLDTTAGKARWWKQRLDQDKRMAGVLQQLDQQWLGPWRCLLMQPGPPAVEAAAAAASQAFVAEQFDCVLGKGPLTYDGRHKCTQQGANVCIVHCAAYFVRLGQNTMLTQA